MKLCLLLMLSGAFVGFAYPRMSAVAAKTRVALAAKIVRALPIAFILLMLVMMDISARSTHYAPAFISGVGLPVLLIGLRVPKSR